jgi:hypothetical protein
MTGLSPLHDEGTGADTEWAMAQEDVGLIRELYEAWPSLLEAEPEVVNRLVRDYGDDGFEFHMPSDYPRASRFLWGKRA